jgi:hypothetical protein
MSYQFAYTVEWCRVVRICQHIGKKTLGSLNALVDAVIVKDVGGASRAIGVALYGSGWKQVAGIIEIVGVRVALQV